MKLPKVSWKLLLLGAIIVAMVTQFLRLWLVNVVVGISFFILVIICLVLSGGAAYTFGVETKHPRIRVAAAVLGIVGGVMAALTLPFIYPYPLDVCVGALASLMVIGGGISVLERPKVGMMLMLLGIIVGLSTMLRQYYLASFFLLPGIALALAPEKKRPATIYVAMVLGIIGGLLALACTFVEDPAWLASFIPHRGLEVLAFWIWVLLFPGMGLLGGIAVLAKQKVSGILMLISGIIGPVGFIALGIPEELFELVLCALAGFPLIIAGTIACIKTRR